MIDYKCSHCGAKLQAPDHFSGQRGTCGKCGAATQVPDAAQGMPAMSVTAVAKDLGNRAPYPGIGRLRFAVSEVLVVLVSAFFVGYLGPEALGFRSAVAEGPSLSIAVLVSSAVVAHLYLCAQRLRNIGRSPLWLILAAIPAVSPFFGPSSILLVN